jgi:hypothetical protein
MRWRLLRRCLLFATLGLITSVAVAWGVAVHWRWKYQYPGPLATGVAVVDQRIVRTDRYWRTALHQELWLSSNTSPKSPRWERRQAEVRLIRELGSAEYDRAMGGARFEDSRSTAQRIDHLAALGPPISDVTADEVYFWRWSAGWPLIAMRGAERIDVFAAEHDAPGAPPADQGRDEAGVWRLSHRWAVRLPWLLPDGVLLPLEPRPGLLLNTTFYALLWALLLLAPGAIRQRIRRAKGRCPTCGFSLAGQPQPGCPECGAGRAPAPASA